MQGALTMSNDLRGTCDELTVAVDIVERHVRDSDFTRDRDKREQIERFLKLSEEISGKFKGNLFLPDLASSRPFIEHIDIDDTKSDWVRIGLAQIDYILTHKFPYVLRDDLKENTKKKIFSALEIAGSH